MKITEKAQMGQIIHDDYRLLQVISRFGVSLGFGDQTVAEACRAAHVHTPTFVAVLNFIKTEGTLQIDELVSEVAVPDLMQYLQRSHSYFIDFRLPAIRRKLIEAINCSSNNQMALLILKFYDGYADEVRRHMAYENEHIHTYVQQLIEGHLPGSQDYATLANQHHDNHNSLAASSHELKSVIIKYYPSDSDTTRLADALMDIYIMEEDLFSHCNLEDTLFARAVHELEMKVRTTESGSPASGTTDSHASGTEGLSEREREVVTFIVRGLSNKEIAERMFISVNTVMTHRRNISRKLQIHSPAGLTIYAIVNGLINLDEVQI